MPVAPARPVWLGMNFFLTDNNVNGVPIVKLFSAYGAAQALEKDRQTIERAVMYADAKRHGEDPRAASLRIAEHTRLNVLTLREALGWNSDKAWAEFMKADRRVCDGVA